jgi:hypothetical protein
MKKNIGKVVRRLAWIAVTGFLLNGNWEWLQTPFFRDSTTSVNEIVWFRLHCTLGDVLLLLSCAIGVSAVRRSTDWLATPRPLDLVLLTSLGVRYTAFSEHVNLARGAWVYSELMPVVVVPGISIGVTPLVQWLLLPTLAAILAARLGRGRE